MIFIFNYFKMKQTQKHRYRKFYLLWFICLIYADLSLANTHNFYSKVALTASHLNDSHHTRAAQGQDGVLDVVSSSNGADFGGQLSLGYYKTPDLRFDVQLSRTKYQLDNSLKVIQPGILGVAAGSSLDIYGDFSANTILFAIHYDLSDVKLSNWTPYLSAGLGLAQIKLTANLQANGAALVNDKDTVSAYTLGLGLSQKIDDYILDIGYHYLAANQPKFQGSINPALNFNSDFQSNALSIGVRFNF